MALPPPLHTLNNHSYFDYNTEKYFLDLDNSNVRLSRLSLCNGMIKGKQNPHMRSPTFLHFDFKTVKVFVTHFLFLTLISTYTEYQNQREYHAVYCMRNHGCRLMGCV